MLRRIFRNRDGGVGSSLSSAILPGCASLVVPLLAVTALELPAAAIDRMAAPLLGRSGVGASLFAPAAATSANGGWSGESGPYGPYRATDGVMPFDPRFVGSLGSESAAASATLRAHGGGSATGSGQSWITDWSDTPMDMPHSDDPGDDDASGGASTAGGEGGAGGSGSSQTGQGGSRGSGSGGNSEPGGSDENDGGGSSDAPADDDGAGGGSDAPQSPSGPSDPPAAPGGGGDGGGGAGSCSGG